MPQPFGPLRLRVSGKVLPLRRLIRGSPDGFDGMAIVDEIGTPKVLSAISGATAAGNSPERS